MRWITIAGPWAHCDTSLSEHCMWGQAGDGDARALYAAARQHVRETGHTVIVERGQAAVLSRATSRKQVDA